MQNEKAKGKVNEKVKKTPQRRCVGCNEHFDKKDLVRVVRTADGEISLDKTGKKAGRGAYLCKNKTCLLQAKKTRRLERAFSCRIDEEIYSALEGEFVDDEK